MIILISNSQSDKAISSASFLGPWEQPEGEAEGSLVKFLIYDCCNFKRSLSSHSSYFIFLFLHTGNVRLGI